MRKIAFIGAGGIMSNFTKYFLETMDLFNKKDMIYIKIFDYDNVEEKNIVRSNQNFGVEDLMLPKAEVLSLKYKDYGIDFENIKIDDTTINKLEGFDDIIMGVDNHECRMLVYKFCLDKKKWLIDMRAQGTIWSYTIVDNTYNMEHYMNTIFKNDEINKRKGSCQLESDVVKDNFQNANKTIAFYVANCIYLQHIRGNIIQAKDFKAVY
jgi:molybdopterin/thiamine biosynthesis adenylyltransferase